MANGQVIRFNEFRGWGFIRGEDGLDYFVHWSFIEGSGYKSLLTNEKVEFEPVKTYAGLQAHNVTYFRPCERSKITLKPNPFTPQEPVIDPNKFAGRGEAIKNAVDALFNHKNIIITGERGIGKSSLAFQLAYLCEGEKTLFEKLEIETNDFEFNYIIGVIDVYPGILLQTSSILLQYQFEIE